MFSFIYPLKALRHASKRGLCWNWLCLQISIWFVSVRITEVSLLVPPNVHLLLMLYNSVCIQVGCKCEAHLEPAHNHGNVFFVTIYCFCCFVTVVCLFVQLFNTHYTMDTDHWLLIYYALSPSFIRPSKMLRKTYSP